jgi:hypothetical protein
MKRLAVLSLIMLLLAPVMAVAQEVRYNFDKSADFSKFKTYKWVPIKDASEVSDLVDKQIKDALDAELATKGLTKVEGDDANLSIGYQPAVWAWVGRRLVWWDGYDHNFGVDVNNL